jgi:uncharacterized protein YlzI (FlbEa/FlbD family)
VIKLDGDDLHETLWVNPDQVSHIAQEGPHVRVWFANGHFRTILDADADEVVERLVRKQ